MHTDDGRRRFCDLDCQRAPRPCGIADCTSPAFAGGLCQGHYRENRRKMRGVNPRLRWFRGYCYGCYRPWRSLVAKRFCCSHCADYAEWRDKTYGKEGYY
jgi:hypothetical protein